MPLTDTHIRSLKPEAKPRKYFDGGGLFLYVPPTGSKLWRMAYRFEGKSKLLSFGNYPAVSLKDARGRREEAKGLLAKGIDPSAPKKPPSANRSRLNATALKTSLWTGIGHVLPDFRKSIREQLCIA
ncbi:MAG: DUF4102 domain-containing protein [Desulfovibrio sp.]|nr:DUF4102 domain-containing protein [Desulfovibrio sp.]